MVKRTMSRKLTAKALTDAYEDAVNDYKAALENDHFQAVKAGATQLPAGFASKDNEQAAHNRIYANMYRALDVIKEQKEAVKDKLIEPPTYEEAAYITAISGRDDLTREEINAALERYGNHNTQHAVLMAAKRSGFPDYYDKTDAERYSEDLDYMAEQVGRLISPFNIPESAGAEGRQLVERGMLESISRPQGVGLNSFEDILTGIVEDAE